MGVLVGLKSKKSITNGGGDFFPMRVIEHEQLLHLHSIIPSRKTKINFSSLYGEGYSPLSIGPMSYLPKVFEKELRESFIA